MFILLVRGMRGLFNDYNYSIIICGLSRALNRFISGIDGIRVGPSVAAASNQGTFPGFDTGLGPGFGSGPALAPFPASASTFPAPAVAG